MILFSYKSDFIVFKPTNPMAPGTADRHAVNCFHSTFGAPGSGSGGRSFVSLPPGRGRGRCWQNSSSLTSIIFLNFPPISDVRHPPPLPPPFPGAKSQLFWLNRSPRIGRRMGFAQRPIVRRKAITDDEFARKSWSNGHKFLKIKSFGQFRFYHS